MRNSKTILGVSCVIALAAGASGAASAATLQRSFVQNATGACQSALPVFEGEIRKRPLAVQNEGDSNAYVSCSFMGTDRSDDGITNILVYADNNSAAPVDMTCTLVTGSTAVTSAYYPKTVSIAAETAGALFMWSEADNDGFNFDNYTINVSCNLPVDTGLSTVFVYYDEDIGALEP